MNPKTYLLAGGNSGIGHATLQLLRADGHRVIAAVRHPEELEDAETLEFDAAQPAAELNLPETIDGLVYFPGTITLEIISRLKG